MKDQEMLLLYAAKAAGIELARDHDGRLRNVTGFAPNGNLEAAPVWNPWSDDGDALRLAVAVGLKIEPIPQAGSVWIHKKSGKPVSCLNEVDIMAAARQAIVLAASDVGKRA